MVNYSLLKSRLFYVLICFIILISLTLISFSCQSTGNTNNANNNTKKLIPVFDKKCDFYEEPFSVTISSKYPGVMIGYTLNGSDPETSTKTIRKKAPVTISIDPYNNPAGNLPSIIIRAYAYDDNSIMIPGPSITQTYIFINKITEFSPDGKRPGPEWPPVNLYQSFKQYIDYGMDEDIYKDPLYEEDFNKAFYQIPSISLVTDIENLFNEKTGLYLNAKFHGREWERPASVEMIDPHDGKIFQINAGLRIRGGWSRHNDFPKHAFRLFFRKEYGNGKLKYSLFGEDGADSFDKVDLRTAQNYSWANPNEVVKHNTFIREVFSRDLQRDMGRLYTRSEYYHLFLNGYYWGLYQTQERPDSRFASSYLGGIKENYDVIKVDTGENWNLYITEATDGNMDAWNELWEYCQNGFDTDEQYFKVQGKDKDGNRNEKEKVLLDIDNLIDFMIVIFYTGNYDSPVTKFSNNTRPNNFYAIYNRTNNDIGFKFLIHDAENALSIEPVDVGAGITEDRVNIKTYMTDPNYFNPHWLHTALSKNKLYCARFSNRIKELFFNNGALTPESNIKRFMSRANEIDMAIIAESARWGDTTKQWSPMTKDDWEKAVNAVIEKYFPYRGEIVLSQLEDAGLYFP